MKSYFEPIDETLRLMPDKFVVDLSQIDSFPGETCHRDCVCPQHFKGDIQL